MLVLLPELEHLVLVAVPFLLDFEHLQLLLFQSVLELGHVCQLVDLINYLH